MDPDEAQQNIGPHQGSKPFDTQIIQVWLLSVSLCVSRAPDMVRIVISIMPFSSPNPMFDHLIESSRQDDYNKWSNKAF